MSKSKRPSPSGNYFKGFNRSAKVKSSGTRLDLRKNNKGRQKK